MNALTPIFYSLSNLLLIPTELALILSLLIAVLSVGCALREKSLRKKEMKVRKALEEGLAADKDFDVVRFFAENQVKLSPAMEVIKSTADKASDDPYVNKAAAEFEDAVKNKCDRAERMVKIGPTLGLMGTLIPLGPALLGLAQGDLNTLAANLVVAFSTTVVGLTIAQIASFVLAAQKRWARRDFILVNFVVDRYADKNAK